MQNKKLKLMQRDLTTVETLLSQVTPKTYIS